MDLKYNIISKGEIVSGFTCDFVKRNIETLLKIDKVQADRICSGDSIKLQSNINLDFANKIKQALYERGLKVCIVECNSTEEIKEVKPINNAIDHSKNNKVSEVLYDVISKGEIVSGFTCNFVKQNIEALLKIEAAKVDRICSGEPITLQSNVQLDFAKKIQKALFEKGLKVYVVARKEEVLPIKKTVKSSPIDEKLYQAPAKTMQAENRPATITRRKPVVAPQLPKANNSVSLSLSYDHTDLSEHHSDTEVHKVYQQMLDNAPNFEIVKGLEAE